MTGHQSSQSQKGNADPSVAIFQKWMNLDELSIKRFGTERLAIIRRQIMEYGKRIVIENRLPELSREARKKPLSNTKLVVKIVTAIAGAMIFGSAMRIFASSLGNLALPAALIGGSLMGYGIDELATRASTNYACRQYTCNILERISVAKNRELALGGNELVKAYWEGQIRVIQTVESAALDKQFPINVALAGFLSLLEYTTAFWIINQMGLFDQEGDLIQIVIAGLPVVLTWVIARIKSQIFNLPEYANDLIQRYKELNLVHREKTMEETQLLAEDEYFTNAQIDSGIRAILDEGSNPKYYTPRLAELDFAVDYYTSKIQEAEDEYVSLSESLETKFNHEVEALSDSFTPLHVHQRERTSKQIEVQQGKLDQQKQEWIEVETKKLKNKLERDKSHIKEKYLTNLKRLNKKAEIAQYEYKKAHDEEFGGSDVS